MRAMKVTEEWLRSHGYKTKDTSASKPYDLLATKDGQEIFVEVKGTTSTDPNTVLMTLVSKSSQKEQGSSALAIVSSIKLHKVGEPHATEGQLDIQIGWDIDQWELTPTAYRGELNKAICTTHQVTLPQLTIPLLTHKGAYSK